MHVMGSDTIAGKTETFVVDTSNILFVLSGAFVGLESIVQRRLGRGVSHLVFPAMRYSALFQPRMAYCSTFQGQLTGSPSDLAHPCPNTSPSQTSLKAPHYPTPSRSKDWPRPIWSRTA